MAPGVPTLPWPAAPNWRSWRHVTKLDPDRPLDAHTLDLVYGSGTDAIMVGGSTGMTREAVSDMLDRLRGAPVPVALEVSSLESAMPGAGLFLIPLVLNTDRSEWLGGAQAAALTHILPLYGPIIPWHLMLPEAYLVLNPASAVAQVTGATCNVSREEAAAHAAFAGRILRLPLIYVEYSGTFGDMELVRAVKKNAGEAHVVYGGGVATPEHASAAGSVADTVVVGNLVYRDPARLSETVAAIKRL